MHILRFFAFQWVVNFSLPKHLNIMTRCFKYLVAVLRTPFDIIRFGAWMIRVTFGARQTADSEERLCVVMLSYKRPANMEWLVRGYLKCEFVDSLVICNNNPDVDLRRYLKTQDPRITLIQRSVHTKQGIRFGLAEERRSQYRFFLSPDDDRFLYPRQIKQLFDAMVRNPAVPMGVEGEVFQEDNPRMGYPFRVGCRGNRKVDHLTGVYGFNEAHLERAAALFDQLGWHDLTKVGNGEDIVISFSGNEQPEIIDIGRQLCCNSWSKEGVATWTTHQNFFQERQALHHNLHKMQRSMLPA
ncbi:MAG: hypothetical protein QNK37_03590 [Acidobacteriota bacterium]|nr:hypothetical protein [Acidobacteriota bacterium]